MDILYVTYALDGLLLVAVPIALGIYLTQKFELYWRLWWIGAAIFILSQVGRIPFDNYVTNQLLAKVNSIAALSANTVLILSALIIGISASLWEELLRYAMFRWWAKDARTWRTGFLAGAGHGGMGAIIIGLLVLYNFINMAMVRNADLSKLVSADQLPFAQAQVTAFWSAPWYSTMNEAVQQLFTIPIQICFALLVLQTFIRKQWYWVVLAIGSHTLFEAVRVVSLNLLNAYLVDMVLGVLAIASIVIIYMLYRTEPPRDLSTELTGPAPTPYRMKAAPSTVEETIKALKEKD